MGDSHRLREAKKNKLLTGNYFFTRVAQISRVLCADEQSLDTPTPVNFRLYSPILSRCSLTLFSWVLFDPLPNFRSAVCSVLTLGHQHLSTDQLSAVTALCRIRTLIHLLKISNTTSLNPKTSPSLHAYHLCRVPVAKDTWDTSGLCSFQHYSPNNEVYIST